MPAVQDKRLPAIQRLPDELLSMIASGLDMKNFSSFVQSLDLHRIGAFVTCESCYTADAIISDLPVQIKRQIRWQAFMTEFGIGLVDFPPVWLDLTRLQRLRVQCSEEDAPRLGGLDLPNLHTLEILIDGQERASQVCRIVEALPRLQILSFESYQQKCQEAEMALLLASERTQKLTMLTIRDIEVEFDRAMSNAQIFDEREGPKILRIVGWQPSLVRTYEIPDGGRKYQIRSASESIETFVQRFKVDPIKFASDPDSILADHICPTFYDACEFFIEGNVVGDDEAMDRFIGLFPNQEVIYSLPKARDLPATLLKYEGKRVVLVADGEVVSLGIDPPPDLEAIVEALGERGCRNKLCILDRNRRPAVWRDDLPFHGWKVMDLQQAYPSMPRRRWLQSDTYLFSFDPCAARLNPKNFQQDARFYSMEGRLSPP